MGKNATLAAAERIDAPKRPYQVLSNLYVDGKDYVPNGVDVVKVELTEDEAKPLIGAGVIQEMPPEPEPQAAS